MYSKKIKESVSTKEDIIHPFISYGMQNKFPHFFFNFAPAGNNLRQVEFT